ncbi:MAG: MBL fold metallo-hydrolase [Acidobacteriota bacterium]|nr:MBL fold metallo-hydrolase [Acidobacteriota bacterium]
MPTLKFLGATRTVTGSKYLLDFPKSRLLVDCGLFQGLKELRLRNWDEHPVRASTIESVVLTHAHLDHCGYLPRLVAQGFRGRIFCTAGTAELCRLVLPDAARIAEEDARSANKHGYSKHRPALPLLTEADAWRAISQLQPVGYERPMPVADGVQVEFLNAGHLLGSSFVRMTLPDGRTILFGGDLGRYGRPVLPDPVAVPEADFLLVESTYGDRLHEPDDNGEHLAEIIRRTADRGGRLVIPSFAIGRVEELVYWIRRLEDEQRIPVLPVYLDSPMAIEGLRYYSQRINELDPGLRPEGRRVCAFCTARFRTVQTPEESKKLTARRDPAIVISSSGMATGGRVLYHLEQTLPDPDNTILFVGYQAAGTRGRRLVDGERQVKMHGRLVDVRARIERLESMSAHADAGEIMRWLGGFTRPPTRTFVVHGEPAAQDTLKVEIQRRLGWTVHVPEYLEQVDLSA